MLWEIDLLPYEDRDAERIRHEAREFGYPPNVQVATARGYLVQADLDESELLPTAKQLFADPIVEALRVAAVEAQTLNVHPEHSGQLVYVLPKPGVMDPVAQTAASAFESVGQQVQAVRTMRKFWFSGIEASELPGLAKRLLANEAIEQIIVGPLPFRQLEVGGSYLFEKVTVPIRELDEEGLTKLSHEGQLHLTIAEMQTIQAHYQKLDRDPSDIELETIAQTWSEHCSHKTLAGRIRYHDDKGTRQFENMLKETIFAATQTIRQQLGEDDWCVSVFKDNAGIVQFDDDYHVVFKVETHNHPSAIEPYGGANTGLGGVIRDPLGTGLGAKPICNTDVFCFAPPDIPPEQLPPGVLHPKRVLQGVVSGVRDYGNRMGIPTVNGAVYFDPRYLGNPLVYCGNVGIIPKDKCDKQVQPGDWIVTVGGRTGRDGIHGATFSSAELTQESESLSGGAVQIGNAITEKMVVDVILQARDRGLYNAITDCGAGGYSSAVGEMGEPLGAEVWLEKVPLKYQGLSYTEIWISEAQERMVLAVPEDKWPELQALCQSENVEATVIGKFVETGTLKLSYEDQPVGELCMEFLHGGRPPVVREATYQPPPLKPLPLPEKHTWDYTPELLAILGSLNVASKEAIIRQYDHEVQGGSVIKPLVGVHNDGPSDAAVVRPRLDSRRGLVIACGMNPYFGDYDPYHMAASAIDEAIRNCVAVGADPQRIAILDNFCWGNTQRPATLGSLVRAALACHDFAIKFQTPFISGKDSLNNEFSYTNDQGAKQTITIPSSLLISAMGQVEQVDRCVTMDLKQSGNFLYQLGTTRNEMGGSHFLLVQGLEGGAVPQVHVDTAKRTFVKLHQAISAGLVQSCHDLSEGGLAVAAAEMAFSGGLGARLFLGQVPYEIGLDAATAQEVQRLADAYPDEEIHPLSVLPEATLILLFSESNSRFLVEVSPEQAGQFEALMQEVPCKLVGEVLETSVLQIVGLPAPLPDPNQEHAFEMSAPLVVEANLESLKQAWQEPLRW